MVDRDRIFSDYVSDDEIRLGAYDEEGCYQIGPQEELVEEYLAKSKELYTSLFKQQIKNVHIKEAKLKKLSERMMKRRNVLHEQECELEEKVKNLSNIKEEIAMEYLKSLGLLTYKPGQKVYVVSSKYIKDGECPNCKGDGYIYITKDQLKFKCTCPVCGTTFEQEQGYKGQGYLEHKEYTIKEGIVSSVYFSFVASTDSRDLRRETITKRLEPYNYSSNTREINISFDGNNRVPVNFSDIYETREAAEAYIAKETNRTKDCRF